MQHAFRPVRWVVFGRAAVVGLTTAGGALALPGLAFPVRLAGLALAVLLAVAVAEPVAETVEVDGDRVAVRSLVRGPRDFARQDSTWSVAKVPTRRRLRSRSVEVLTLTSADGRTAYLALKRYRPDDKVRLLAAVGQALPGAE